MSLEGKAAKKLIKEKKTLSLAESCTGGLLSHRLTNITGSSNFLKLGLVVYSNEAKIKLLHVPSKTLKIYGAVSPQTALAMAKGVRKIHNTDIGLAVTGIAGPTGASKNKPVGLTFMAIAAPAKSQCQKYRFTGSRTRIKAQAATQALNLLLNFI